MASRQPEPIRSRVVALIADRFDRARFTDALRGRAWLDAVDTIAELEKHTWFDPHTIVGVVVEPRDAQSVPVGPALSRIRERFPQVPLIGFCDAGHQHSRSILELAAAGVHELIFRQASDVANVQRCLARATEASVAELVLARVLPRVSEAAAPYVAYGARHAYEALDVQSFAAAFGVHRKTLATHCRDANLPAPSALIAWCRLFLIAYLMERGGWTVESIAYTLDAPSAGSLRMLVKRYTGERPSGLRTRGGLGFVLERFLAPTAVGRDRRRLTLVHAPGDAVEEGLQCDRRGRVAAMAHEA